MIGNGIREGMVETLEVFTVLKPAELENLNLIMENPSHRYLGLRIRAF